MIDDFREDAILARLQEMEGRSDEITAELSRPETLSDRQIMQKLGREQRELQEPLALYQQI
jgi:hypothetical protein